MQILLRRTNSDCSQWPAWTSDLDSTLAEFMTRSWKPKGTVYYHLSNDAAEDTTWYDFAVEILKGTDVEISGWFQQIPGQG